MAADDVGEFVELDELRNGEFADGENECGFEDFDFLFEPASARRDFDGIGHAVTACRVLPGKQRATAAM